MFLSHSEASKDTISSAFAQYYQFLTFTYGSVSSLNVHTTICPDLPLFTPGSHQHLIWTLLLVSLLHFLLKTEVLNVCVLFGVVRFLIPH